MGWASGIVGVITAGVLACGMAACGGASGASAHPPSAAQAGATAVPVPVRVQPNVVGWSGMLQRPDHIYVGMGGAPIVRQLTWRNWGGAQAWASGQLDIYLPQPGPISGWHPTTYPVRVRLQDIRDPRRPARVPQDDRLLREPPWGKASPELHLLRAARRLHAGLERARGDASSREVARAGLAPPLDVTQGRGPWFQSGNTRQLLLAVATSRPAPSWISAAASATRRPGLVTRPTATRVPLSTVTGRR